jgi:LAS superfamily LD-carboxypeptidase LdcB
MKKLYLIILLSVIAVGMFPTVTSAAITFKDFYLQSRITHYDRNATDNLDCITNSLAADAPAPGTGAGPATPGGPIAGSNNQQKAYNYLISKGLTAPQAAGIVGNLIAESTANLSPTITNSIGAYGIAQWLGGRKTSLQKLPNYDTLEVQLDFLWSELSGGYSSVLSSIKATSDVSVATRIFLERYEIPCMPGRACDDEQAKRLAFSKSVLEKYGGTAAVTQTTTAAAQATTESTANATPAVCQKSAAAAASAGGTASGTGTASKPGNYADPNQKCPAGTTDKGTIKTKYSGGLVSTPYPQIRLCALSSISNATVNAAVAAQFQQMGEAANAAGRHLSANSSFRLEDSCGGSGSYGCAAPGQSNHQLGIAIDFALNDGKKSSARGCQNRATSTDPRWIWLRDNAPGFGIRQLDYENWHWSTDSRNAC